MVRRTKRKPRTAARRAGFLVLRPYRPLLRLARRVLPRRGLVHSLLGAGLVLLGLALELLELTVALELGVAQHVAHAFLDLAPHVAGFALQVVSHRPPPFRLYTHPL